MAAGRLDWPPATEIRSRLTPTIVGRIISGNLSLEGSAEVVGRRLLLASAMLAVLGLSAIPVAGAAAGTARPSDKQATTTSVKKSAAAREPTPFDPDGSGRCAPGIEVHKCTVGATFKCGFNAKGQSGESCVWVSTPKFGVPIHIQVQLQWYCPESHKYPFLVLVGFNPLWENRGEGGYAVQVRVGEVSATRYKQNSDKLYYSYRGAKRRCPWLCRVGLSEC